MISVSRLVSFLLGLLSACIILLLQESPSQWQFERKLREILGSAEGIDDIKLGIWGGYDPPAIAFYQRVISDPKEHQYMVMQVLGVLGSPNIKTDRSQLLPSVYARLMDQKAAIRRSAVILLARIGGTRDAVPIAALLADSDITVTYAAAKALSEIGEERAVVALDIWLRSDSHKDVRELRDHVRRFRAALEARLDRTAPPPREVKR